MVLPKGWGGGKGKPLKRAQMKMVAFEGGPLDGQVVRYREEFWPPYWNHIHRRMEVVKEVGELPPTALVVGEYRLEETGEKCPVIEYRDIYRYTRTAEVRGDAQVYRLYSGPVPMELDPVGEGWKQPEEYEDLLRVEGSATLEPQDPDDPKEE